MNNLDVLPKKRLDQRKREFFAVVGNIMVLLIVRPRGSACAMGAAWHSSVPAVLRVLLLCFISGLQFFESFFSLRFTVCVHGLVDVLVCLDLVS